MWTHPTNQRPSFKTFIIRILLRSSSSLTSMIHHPPPSTNPRNQNAPLSPFPSLRNRRPILVPRLDHSLHPILPHQRLEPAPPTLQPDLTGRHSCRTRHRKPTRCIILHIRRLLRRGRRAHIDHGARLELSVPGTGETARTVCPHRSASEDRCLGRHCQEAGACVVYSGGQGCDVLWAGCRRGKGVSDVQLVFSSFR